MVTPQGLDLLAQLVGPPLITAGQGHRQGKLQLLELVVSLRSHYRFGRSVSAMGPG